jgi:tRNA nucleotidyltransferase (CCA-adding enzyme)
LKTVARHAVPSLGRLPRKLGRAVAAARATARERGERLFLVGGVVRDLLLDRPIRDLDLVIEGEAAPFARALASRLGGAVREHGRFGTASLHTPDGGRIDVAASRRESYPHPGALPRVAPAGIEEDLARRDFTINALALEIAPARTPRLLDPFGGRADLAANCLRFLHSASPADDPTRAFRAVRYANRLGLAIEPGTIRTVARAIASGSFDGVSGDRLRREIELLFAEPNAAGAARLVAALGLPRALGVKLPASRRALARVKRAESLGSSWPEAAGWPLVVLAWSADRPPSEVARLADRLGATGEARSAFHRWGVTRRLLPRLARARKPSETRRLLAGLAPVEAAALSVCLPPRAAERVVSAAHGTARLTISGRDLVEAGVPPGPAIGRALEDTLDARLDGRLRASGELAFALRRAAGKREAVP